MRLSDNYGSIDYLFHLVEHVHMVHTLHRGTNSGMETLLSCYNSDTPRMTRNSLLDCKYSLNSPFIKAVADQSI